MMRSRVYPLPEKEEKRVRLLAAALDGRPELEEMLPVQLRRVRTAHHSVVLGYGHPGKPSAATSTTFSAPITLLEATVKGFGTSSSPFATR